MIGRITVLGGSSVYIPEFMTSLISHNITVKEIVLVGRGGKKLRVVAEFCQRLLDNSGLPAKVRSSCDLIEAVEGAKYIVSNVRVGGMTARLRDEKLPVKYDMIGSESIGAGGFANAMRTLPVMMRYAEQIEAVNPGATFINLTNPMGIVMEALLNHSNLKAVGLCDLPSKYVKKVARIFRREPSELSVNYLGVNHMGWIQDVKIERKSRMFQLLERVRRHKEYDDFDYDLIELFRMIPTRAVSLYFNRNEILKKQKSRTRFRAEMLYEAEQQILKLYENKDLHEVPELTKERNALWYEENLVPFIEAAETTKTSELILCVRNGQTIRDLPEDCSVEVPVGVSKRGIKARKVGSLPGFLKGLFIAVKESHRLTIEAVRHNSYEYALQALTINPLVPSLSTARQFLDHIIREEGLELH